MFANVFGLLLMLVYSFGMKIYEHIVSGIFFFFFSEIRLELWPNVWLVANGCEARCLSLALLIPRI